MDWSFIFKLFALRLKENANISQPKPFLLVSRDLNSHKIQMLSPDAGTISKEEKITKVTSDGLADYHIMEHVKHRNTGMFGMNWCEPNHQSLQAYYWHVISCFGGRREYFSTAGRSTQ